MPGLCSLAVPARRTPLWRASVKQFSSSSRRSDYHDTLPNLKIGAHTRVLYQGFTGRQATANAKESLEWGTKIVGGVKPRVESHHLGLPIFPSVRIAQENVKADASAIYVPGSQTAHAIEEAIEAEIPLVVAVAEHVPLHDMLRVHSILKTQSKTRLVGANCPGIISAIGRCRIGFQPLPCFAPGNIGIVAKSGTLSYETVASTTRAGLGQSLCISMGGDPLAGTNFVDALRVFENDPDTQGIILVGEIGGTAEMKAAEWIASYRQRTENPKPIMALVGGMQAPPGRVMGHAGAWTSAGEPGPQEKYKALERAGAVMVNHPEKFGEGMKALLASRPSTSTSSTSTGSIGTQKRGLHTMRRTTLHNRPTHQQSRSLYIKQLQAFNLIKEAKTPVKEQVQTIDTLKEAGVPVKEVPESPSDIHICLTIDRTACSPAFIASTSPGFERGNATLRIPFDYNTRTFSNQDWLVAAIVKHFKLPYKALPQFAQLIRALWHIFRAREAFSLEVRVSFDLTAKEKLEVTGAKFGFDDAAFRSAERQEKLHALRDKKSEVPEEVQAEKWGIVYVKLDGKGTIGTLVNGAGLAMNTVDAVTSQGGHCANFLDTGGKATSETVKSSFRVIISDPRVRAIFVNIFGGLTRCDMIAEGIIMAIRDLNMQVPVVVRLRGTNEGEGQRMIAESGLPLHAFDGFEDAARKVIQLAARDEIDEV